MWCHLWTWIFLMCLVLKMWKLCHYQLQRIYEHSLAVKRVPRPLALRRMDETECNVSHLRLVHLKHCVLGLLRFWNWKIGGWSLERGWRGMTPLIWYHEFNYPFHFKQSYPYGLWLEAMFIWVVGIVTNWMMIEYGRNILLEDNILFSTSHMNFIHNEF